MSHMGNTLSSQEATNWREGRRLRAWELKQEGWKQQDIARALGVSKGAVSQWMKRAQQEGIEGLRHRPPPGAKARLSEDERAKLRSEEHTSELQSRQYLVCRLLLEK